MPGDDGPQAATRQVLNVGGRELRESQGAASKVDARAKVAISLKEMRESNFFLRIFQELKTGDENRIDYLVVESGELMKILGKIFRSL